MITHEAVVGSIDRMVARSRLSRSALCAVAGLDRSQTGQCVARGNWPLLSTIAALGVASGTTVDRWVADMRLVDGIPWPIGVPGWELPGALEDDPEGDKPSLRRA